VSVAQISTKALAPTKSLIDESLEKQQSLTAVEKFTQRHADTHEPLQAKYYRDLIPLTSPGKGQQYAFEVNLDNCSGCKACVSACHALNGLDEDETWRSVGLLHGGTSALPVLQHVTSACHHCLDPACLDGCPVNAYEKDPLTGIVKHLDDQCIGCQYCILKCPYDVPKYSKRLGIVRKCDMCSDRLAVGEAPACVQACPTSAIRITVVDTQTVIEDSEADLFLPGAPGPQYTRPTTTYKTRRALPRNLLPADYYTVAPGHSHLALVSMLVLTQMSVGTFVVDIGLDAFADGRALVLIRPVRVIAALLLGLLGLGAAVGHLGRPLYAFRAIIGLRTSWLSREILTFGLFAFFAAAYGANVWLDHRGLAANPWDALRLAAAACGLMGVFCSVMIYVDTRRPFWGFSSTALKFFLTGLVLGIPAAILVSLLGAVCIDSLSLREVQSEFGQVALRGLVAASAVKLAVESLVLFHLRDREQTALKRTALLLTGELAPVFLKRVAFGLVGGVALPLVLIGEGTIAGPGGFRPMFECVIVGLTLMLTLLGELLERYLFFTAAVAPKMPGAVAS
jgi:Fe-S-cluster-containing dehydrogenase component/DMSO reductase anchor subunit